jgi:two-component system NtrC family sensor kinase
MAAALDGLERILDDASIGFWQLHVPSGKLTHNDAFRRMTQIQADDVSQSPDGWADGVHPADRQQVIDQRQRLIAGEIEAYWIEYRQRRSDGDWVLLRTRVSVIERDSAGKVLRACGTLTDITRERELARLMSAVFDRPFQFIGLLTPEGVLVQTNKSSLKSGHRLEDVLGKPFWQEPFFAYSPALQTQIREGIVRAAGGELVRFEIRHPDRDGIFHTVDFTLTPLRDDDGTIVNIIPEGRDITDLACAREALRETQQRLNTATEAANIGLWEWEIQHDRIWFSDHWYRMLGLQPSPVPSSSKLWTDLIHPDDRARVISEMENQLSERAAEYRNEFRTRRSDGSWGWFRSTARVVDQDADGKVLRIAGVLIDSTDRHTVEGRLLLATQGGNVGLWEAHLGGGAGWFSDHYWLMLGYQPDELPATFDTAQQLAHPDDRSRLRDTLRALQAGSTVEFDLDYRVRRKDGSLRWIHSQGQVIERAHDGSPVRITGVQIDVTDRKEAERRLASAERLESIGRLAAGVAHEINTPMQYVNDNVYFIREGVQELLARINALQATLPANPVPSSQMDLQQELPTALESVIDGLARVTEIVRSMKEFSHPDQAVMRPVDLNRAIQSTLVVGRGEFKHIADVETIFGELPPVMCHGGQINQVVLNLVVNAAHAIADATKGTGAKGRITIKTIVDDGDVVISVGDTGGGIPEAIRHRIFEPFFTTKGLGHGTGQGLAIAHNVIVNGHGGALSFLSQTGHGTTFLVRLPIECRTAEFRGEAA